VDLVLGRAVELLDEIHPACVVDLGVRTILPALPLLHR
jgi:hypothetical protein